MIANLHLSFHSLLLWAMLLTMATAAAQDSPTRLGDVRIQGSIRSRLEFWDWFGANDASRYAFSGNILRLNLSQSEATYDWQIEIAAPFLFDLPADAVASGAQGQLGLGGTYFAANDGRHNAGMIFPKQAFTRFKSGSRSIRLGRFEFSEGSELIPSDPTLAWLKRERISQRIIGPFAWSHVGRSFDGAQYEITGKNRHVNLVAVLPTRGAFQVDGWGNLKIAIGYAALTQQHPGKNHNIDWRAFGVYYHDWRGSVPTDNRPGDLRSADRGNIRIASFGGHYLHRISTPSGVVDLLFWGLAQTGRWGRLDHRASTWAWEAGWQPRVLPHLRPWLRAGYFRGSGDRNPNDNAHGTFFQMLPTPRPFARMPFYNLMNNEDLMAVLVLRPHRALGLRLEAHALRLAQKADLWYSGGGAYQPWSFGYTGRPSNGNRSLANLYDISAEYNANPRFTLAGYLGLAIGHSVIRSIYPDRKDGSFGYLEALLRF
jgi:hypothetical protein